MERTDDAQVLRDSVNDPERFGVLYERHAPAVHGYLRRRVGDGPAWDLTAEAFVRAFRSRSRYEARHPTVLPWLLGIATNVVREHRRDERRRLRTLERLVETADAGAAPTQASALTPQLVRALRRLRADDRDALLLVVWGELSYDEAAQALDVPIGTIRSRIARARRALTGDLPAPAMRAAWCTNGDEHA